MKTQKYIPILLLLIFTSSFSGLAQTNAHKPGLPDVEVIRLRNELVKAVENDSIEKARDIKDTLWAAQPSKGDYLTFQEYYLTLFLTLEFDEILLRLLLKKPRQSDPTIFPQIYTNLLAEAKQKQLLIFSEIENFRISQRREMLRESFIGLLYGCQPKQAGRTEDFESGLAIGMLYKSGIYRGNISNYFSSYQQIKPLYFNFYKKKLFFDFGLSLLGIMGKMNNVKILDNEVEGDFYGKYNDLYASIGYQLFNKKRISLYTLVSGQVILYHIYLGETYFFRRIRFSGEVNNGSTICIGPGFFADYNILNLGNSGQDFLALRFRYNFFPIISDNQTRSKGTIHEFNIGLIIKGFFYE